MSLSPVDVHTALEDLGTLTESQAPGTYAIRVAVPDGVESVQRQWLDAIDAPLPDAYAEQLAAAETCLYVGRSGDVYDRLLDHARGDVRKASFVHAFGVAGVRGVWPGDENSVVAERARAQSLSDASTVCWMDGELL